MTGRGQSYDWRRDVLEGRSSPPSGDSCPSCEDWRSSARGRRASDNRSMLFRWRGRFLFGQSAPSSRRSSSVFRPSGSPFDGAALSSDGASVSLGRDTLATSGATLYAGDVSLQADGMALPALAASFRDHSPIFMDQWFLFRLANVVLPSARDSPVGERSSSHGWCVQFDEQSRLTKGRSRFAEKRRRSSQKQRSVFDDGVARARRNASPDDRRNRVPSQ